MNKLLMYLRYMRITRCRLHKCQETLVLQIFIFLKLKYNYILFAFHLLPPVSGKYHPHNLSQIQIFFSLLLLWLPLFLVLSTWCSMCFLYLYRCIPLVWESFLLWSLAYIYTMPLTWDFSHLSMLMFQKFDLSKLSHISGIFDLFFIVFNLISLLSLWIMVFHLLFDSFYL